MKVTKTMMMVASVALIAAPMAVPTAAMAQELPLVGGSDGGVSGIFLKDSADLKYAEYLAANGAESPEYGKSPDWVSHYCMYNNVNPRDDKPDLYIRLTYPSVPDAAEGERCGAAFFPRGERVMHNWQQRTAIALTCPPLAAQ